MAKSASTGKAIYISVDIGYDTTKSAFAYNTASGFKKGIIEFGREGFPSLAYYDEKARKWRFGDEAYDITERSAFKFMVRIKDLLDLIDYEKGEYYFKKKFFPIFEFPMTEKVKTDFGSMVKKGKCFEANVTPQAVCQMFLATYLAAVNAKIGALEGVARKYTAVYPGGASKEQYEELCRLCEVEGGDADARVISAPKAVGIAAKEYGVLGAHKNVLLFNVGACSTSVAKLTVTPSNISVDSVESHSAPIDFGGNDFDECINNMVMAKSAEIPAFGTKDDGTNIIEKGTYYQQFMLMRSVKNGKKRFSTGVVTDEGDVTGVFTVQREMEVKIPVVRKEFVKECQGLYEKLWQYMRSELKLPINKDVTAVVVSGGTADLYNLDKYAESKLKKSFSKVSYIDFSPYDEKKARDTVLCDPRYTAALGAALFGAGVYKMELVMTYAYGTYNPSIQNGYCAKFACILEKGERIASDGKIAGIDRYENERNAKTINNTALSSDGRGVYVKPNEYYKIARADYDGKPICSAATFDGMSKSEFLRSLIGVLKRMTAAGASVRDEVRRDLVQNYGFATVLTGNFVFDRNVNGNANFKLLEGFHIDVEGRATPIVKNVSITSDMRATKVWIEADGAIKI